MVYSEKSKAAAIENENHAKELLKGIAENFKTDPKVIAEVLAFSSNFYSYSARNTRLIYAQNPHATFCQSFAAWKKAGASVLKGQKSLKIWVPVQSTLLEPEPGKFVQLFNATDEQKELYRQGKITGYTRTHFKIGNVFDISQTDFPPERYPELYSMGFSSEEHNKIFHAICEFSNEKLNCPIKENSMDTISLRGCYYPRKHEIIINDKLQDTMKLSTTLHELGHALMHHCMPNTTAAQKEIEADSLSIILESTFGIESTDARKRHFVSHYEAFKKEVYEFAPETEDKEVVLSDAINTLFEDVLRVYRDHIEQIQKYVEKQIPREIDIEKEKGKSNKKTSITKGAEQDASSPRNLGNKSFFGVMTYTSLYGETMKCFYDDEKLFNQEVKYHQKRETPHQGTVLSKEQFISELSEETMKAGPYMDVGVRLHSDYSSDIKDWKSRNALQVSLHPELEKLNAKVEKVYDWEQSQKLPYSERAVYVSKYTGQLLINNDITFQKAYTKMESQTESAMQRAMRKRSELNKKLPVKSKGMEL